MTQKHFNNEKKEKEEKEEEKKKPFQIGAQHLRKSLVICVTPLAGGLLLKKLKYFEVMLNIFEFLQM